jgi:hypothetical protein
VPDRGAGAGPGDFPALFFGLFRKSATELPYQRSTCRAALNSEMVTAQIYLTYQQYYAPRNAMLQAKER